MADRTRRTRKVEEIVPDAARTVASLRDIGYDTPRAIADLVDNSIAAGATKVDVTFHFDGEHSWIRVTDNGAGMDGDTLQEALRYGSNREYSSDDLGKFGFGLKTASTSQCRRVTVASRRAQQRARHEVRCLDLEHIEETRRWEILVLDGSDRPEHVIEPLQDHTGTVVLWEDLDRILEYKDPWGEWAQKKLLALAEEVDQHLAMVFHRFLAGEVKDRPELKITINGKSKVEPWDPFCRSEPKTESFPAKDVQVASDGGVGFVRVNSYVLPAQRDFSSDAAWRRASGPMQWNRQQGLYVYRANRLIQSGGWNRIRAQDEHTKLARMSLDFFPDLDAVFGINIAKAYVNLPQDLREQLRPLISQCTRSADQKYRNERPKSGTGGASPSAVPARSNRKVRSEGGIEFGTGAFDPYGNRQDVARRRTAPREAIEEVAEHVGEAAALKKIIGGLRAQHPEVARDLGW
jgi:anti-sigma regulatory factor (Ser/Thr protein kinase)